MDHQAGQSVSVGLRQLTDVLIQHGKTVVIILDFYKILTPVVSYSCTYLFPTLKFCVILISERLTGRFHEGFVEVEGEQWLWEASEEVLEDTCNDVDVVYFVKRWQSLSSNQLVLQLFHHALLARDPVQADLGEGKIKETSSHCLAACDTSLLNDMTN